MYGVDNFNFNCIVLRLWMIPYWKHISYLIVLSICIVWVNLHPESSYPFLKNGILATKHVHPSFCSCLTT